MMRRVAILACLGLVACASKLELRPDDGSVVTVEFIQVENALRAGGHVSIYMDDYDCYGFSAKGGTGTAAMPATKTVAVPGRRFLTIGSSYFGAGIGTTRSCNTLYTFPIETGARYRIAIGNDGSKCYTGVTQLASGANAGETPVKLTARTLSVPGMDNQGPWCKPNPAFTGSSSLAVPRGN